jgi:hypothetical protein
MAGNFGPTMIWPVLDIRPEGVILLYNRGCVIGWLWRVTIDNACEKFDDRHNLEK